MAKTVKGLKELHDRLQEQVDSMSKTIHAEISREVNRRIQEEKVLIAETSAQTLRNLDEIIVRKFRSYFIVASIIATVLTAIGYFAVIPKVIGDAVGKDAASQAEKVLKQIENHLSEAQTHVKKLSGESKRVVLFNDYGPNSGYAASFSGALSQIDPKVRIETYQFLNSDFNLSKASWQLWRYSRTFPRGTIIVSLANPGAEVLDKIVLVTKSGPIFIAHNNGLLDHVATEFEVAGVYRITNPELNPESLTNPFNGGGVFAPIAGHISQDRKLEEIGTKLQEYRPKLAPTKKEVNVVERTATCTVMDIDVFGNVETNLLESDLRKIGIREGVSVNVEILNEQRNGSNFSILVKRSHGDLPVGETVAVFDEDLFKIGLNQESFAKERGLTPGTELVVSTK